MPKINYKMNCKKTPKSHSRKYHEIVIVLQYSLIRLSMAKQTNRTTDNK